jgi:hypothetical protein
MAWNPRRAKLWVGLVLLAIVALTAAPAVGVSSAPAGRASPPPETPADHDGLEQVGEVLGFVTVTLLLATVSLGVLRRINPRRMLKAHKLIAAATVVGALCHATIMLAR